MRPLMQLGVCLYKTWPAKGSIIVCILMMCVRLFMVHFVNTNAKHAGTFSNILCHVCKASVVIGANVNL